MILTERLSLVATMVDKGAVVADLGTDHGYLPVYLVKKGICSSAIACDINKGPLEKGRQNIALNHLEDKIETRLSDGLENIKPNEADTFIIAGMGADVIIHIISSCPFILDQSYTLIIQPMSKYYVLIEWLYKKGFNICKQECTHEGKRHYTVIKAVYSGEEKNLSPVDTYIGRMDLTDRECKDFLNIEIKKAEKRSIGDKALLPVIKSLKEKLI